MSQWTHVAGLIRIDTFPNQFPMERLVREAFGKTQTWQDIIKDMKSGKSARSITEDKCIVPSGSEGSLDYKIEEMNDGSVRWGSVAIWGDLRDYGDKPEEIDAIFQWIKNAHAKLSKISYFRSCAVKIDVEYLKSFLIRDCEGGVEMIELSPTIITLEEEE